MRRGIGLVVVALAFAPNAEAAVPKWVPGYVRDVVRSKFGYDFTRVSGVRCRQTGRKRYRCSFRARTDFRYRGSVRIYPYTAPDGDELQTLKFRWYRGTCGELGQALPFAIRTHNVTCSRARQLIYNWYSGGRPLDPYDCSLRSAPSTARCSYGRRQFSFKYPE